MKSTFFLILLISFFSSANVIAQTVNLTGKVSTNQDYHTINFNSNEGDMNVTLPGDLSSPGLGSVTLSGSVSAEPAGKT
ncbi:MAG TPA: hypothetical protein VFV08_14755, partial [Puia sp.]|nr:hypothetical protein [Puia sp.]